jgi:hypothetical protein
MPSQRIPASERRLSVSRHWSRPKNSRSSNRRMGAMHFPRGKTSLASAIFMVTLVTTIRPRKIFFSRARVPYGARGVHPAVPPSWFQIVMLIGGVKPRLNGLASESCARRECRRSPPFRVWPGWRVEAIRPPDLSNNRKAPDRLGPSRGRLTPGPDTHRADTSRLRSPRLQPSLGHRTFDDMPLDSFAMLAGKRSKVLARRAWLNCRELHRRTTSRTLRTLVLCIEHGRSLT